MITRKALIATGATLTSVAAFAGISLGAWDTAGPAKSWADKPIVMTEVQIVRKTVHIKPKPKKVVAVKPRTVSNVTGSGTAVAASDPPQATSAPSTYAQRPTRSNAPTVSTHSSGSGSSSEGESEGQDNKREHEGSDD